MRRSPPVDSGYPRGPPDRSRSCSARRSRRPGCGTRAPLARSAPARGPPSRPPPSSRAVTRSRRPPPACSSTLRRRRPCGSACSACRLPGSKDDPKDGSWHTRASTRLHAERPFGRDPAEHERGRKPARVPACRDAPDVCACRVHARCARASHVDASPPSVVVIPATTCTETAPSARHRRARRAPRRRSSRRRCARGPARRARVRRPGKVARAPGCRAVHWTTSISDQVAPRTLAGRSLDRRVAGVELRELDEVALRARAPGEPACCGRRTRPGRRSSRARREPEPEPVARAPRCCTEQQSSASRRDVPRPARGLA